MQYVGSFGSTGKSKSILDGFDAAAVTGAAASAAVAAAARRVLPQFGIFQPLYFPT